jgi:hypothetical protein
VNDPRARRLAAQDLPFDNDVARLVKLAKLAVLFAASEVRYRTATSLENLLLWTVPSHAAVQVPVRPERALWQRWSEAARQEDYAAPSFRFCSLPLPFLGQRVLMRPAVPLEADASEQRQQKKRRQTVSNAESHVVLASALAGHAITPLSTAVGPACNLGLQSRAHKLFHVKHWGAIVG